MGKSLAGDRSGRGQAKAFSTAAGAFMITCASDPETAEPVLDAACL